MKRKILWLGLSLLLVAALVLTACPAPVEPIEPVEPVEPIEPIEPIEPVEPIEPIEPVVGEPIYGGTLTYLMDWLHEDPPSPDVAEAFWASSAWLNPILENPVIGGFVKLGPRGTGEYPFEMGDYIPMEFVKGQLLEDWEITLEKMVWHVRPGIYWAADNVAYMENRELVAEDIIADLNYLVYDSWGGWDAIGEIYATDRYTLVIETPVFDIDMMHKIGYGWWGQITPPELVEAGAHLWENQVGTGPFMLNEYVVGSHMKFERNPNYWGTTPINGVEYPIPFVDYLVMPILPDPATQVAVLRTGRADYFWMVPAEHWRILDETAPGIVKKIFTWIQGYGLYLNCANPPFDSVEVRRAMTIGTNRGDFAVLQGVTGLPFHWFPLQPGGLGYTPLEELPADIRILYDYDPVEAKRLLGLAGYPDGFTISLYTETDPLWMDRADLLAAQWAKLGVTLEIKATDRITRVGHEAAGTYPNVMYDEYGSPCPGWPLDMGVTGNPLGWSNERYDELVDMISGEVDEAKRASMLREAALIQLRGAAFLTHDMIGAASYWWPWVKNYYGEVNIGNWNNVDIVAPHAWLDLDLKAEMGFRR